MTGRQFIPNVPSRACMFLARERRGGVSFRGIIKSHRCPPICSFPCSFFPSLALFYATDLSARGARGARREPGGGGKCKRRKSTYSSHEFFTTISLAHMDIFAVI